MQKHVPLEFMVTIPSHKPAIIFYVHLVRLTIGIIVDIFPGRSRKIDKTGAAGRVQGLTRQNGGPKSLWKNLVLGIVSVLWTRNRSGHPSTVLHLARCKAGYRAVAAHGEGCLGLCMI